jgi:AAA domain
MTTKFRIDAIAIDTDSGRVSYIFPSPLTVLAGPVGVGKSTLFELMKYCLGGKAELAEVIRQHVLDAHITISIGEENLRLSRGVDPSRSKTVRVHDLLSDFRLPDQDAEATSGDRSLSQLLLRSLGLPTEARATGRTANSKPGSRVTFSDVFSTGTLPTTMNHIVNLNVEQSLNCSSD